jgi:hypothetical protein
MFGDQKAKQDAVGEIVNTEKSGTLSMNRATRLTHRAADERPHAQEVRQQLARIVGSAAFRDSLRLSRFLSFVVEATLEGKGAEIKAYTVAVEALNRRSDFDPQVDSIVRVEAGRLRTALARYYSDAGRDDRLAIDLPRGTYVPTFTRRGAESPRQSPATQLRIEPSSGSARSGEMAGRSRQLGDALKLFQKLFEIQRQQVAAVNIEIASARETLTNSRALLEVADNYGVPWRQAPTLISAAPSSSPDALTEKSKKTNKLKGRGTMAWAARAQRPGPLDKGGRCSAL